MDEPTEKAAKKPNRRHEELEQLLDLAERLKGQCEGHIARRERLRFLQFAAIGMMVSCLSMFSILAASLERSGRNVMFEFVVLITGAVSSMMCFVYAHFYVLKSMSRNSRWFRSDSMALKDVLRLLREAEGLPLASHWSALDRARFRIQLSRFSIGDEYEKDFPVRNAKASDGLRVPEPAKPSLGGIVPRPSVSDA